MAGLPTSIVERAKSILKQKFENNEQIFETLMDENTLNDNIENDFLKQLLDEIKATKTDEITPIEALKILNDIKTKYSN